MTEIAWLVSAVLLGGALGALYFAALWATVRRVTRLSAWQLQLALWARLGVLLAGLYAIGGDDWRRWACALFGVVIARSLYVRRVAAMAHRAEQPGS